MAIPTIYELALPSLQYLGERGECSMSEVRSAIADRLQLNSDDITERMQSGELRFKNRVRWAIYELKIAGFVETPRRMCIRITQEGRILLQNPPPVINHKFLMGYEIYAKNRNSNRVPIGNPPGQEEAPQLAGLQPEPDPPTPEDAMSEAHERMGKILADEMLERILQSEPDFFERLTVKLVEAMGYGGTEGAGKHIGGPGDGGVDGVIEQDALGLDKIYVQAKRYSAENKIGSPEIERFSGSLGRKQVNKGIFITTSGFTPEARKAAGEVEKNIVLIDGEELARLMIRYNVGCRVKGNYEIKSLDEEFFEEG